MTAPRPTPPTPAKERKSLAQYKAQLEGMDGGTVPVSMVREIIDVAEEEIEARQHSLTISEAMLRSGRSRSFFEHRMKGWKADGHAQKRGTQWFIAAEVVPVRRLRGARDEGFDPDVDSIDDAARALLTS